MKPVSGFALIGSMAPHWHTPLPEPIALTSGTSLRTLLDVGAFLRANYEGRRTPPVEATISALLRAADTGDEADRHLAYERVARLLRFNRLI